jgi:hypothetical protein
MNRASLQLSLIFFICAGVLISGSSGPGDGTEVSKYDGRLMCSGTGCPSLTKPGFTTLYKPNSLLEMNRNKICNFYGGEQLNWYHLAYDSMQSGR